MHTDDARRVLAVWRENLLTDAQVADWAAEALDATPANDLPEWLLDLCMYGVTACMNRPSSEFLDVPLLSFAERLAIRVRKLDLSRSDQLEEFVDWVSRACMGEDSARPEVSFGYYVDHLWGDCRKMDEAQAYVRKELPEIARSLPEVTPELDRLLRQQQEK
jgi:hypothetical protein